jgi:hypothetical protein
MKMIPQKAAVPARILGLLRKPHQKMRLAVAARNWEIDAKSHNTGSGAKRPGASARAQAFHLIASRAKPSSAYRADAADRTAVASANLLL